MYSVLCSMATHHLPMNSFKPMIPQMALVKVSGPQNQQKGIDDGKGLEGQWLLIELQENYERMGMKEI